VQIALRVGALGLVVAWLLSRRLQELVPYQLPFAVLLATEAEFLARAWRERRAAPAATPTAEPGDRRLPDSTDADLGWGEIVEGEDGLVYVPPPPRPERRRSAGLLAVAGVFVAAVLFVLAARVDRSATWDAVPTKTKAAAEARFTREAARIAGRPVSVRCDDGYAYTGVGSDALGVAFPRRALAFLEPDVCKTLTAVVFDGDRRERAGTAEAVLVLAHEAVHLGGERDEGVTECRALQEGVTLGARLGLPEDRARRMMASLYARNLAERAITRLTYRLPEGCHDGGQLDLRPADDRFP
jgi:hypothetical protein